MNSRKIIQGLFLLAIASLFGFAAGFNYVKKKSIYFQVHYDNESAIEEMEKSIRFFYQKNTTAISIKNVIKTKDFTTVLYCLEYKEGCGTMVILNEFLKREKPNAERSHEATNNGIQESNPKDPQVGHMATTKDDINPVGISRR